MGTYILLHLDCKNDVTAIHKHLFGTPKIFWYTRKFYQCDHSSKFSIFSQHLLRHQAATIVYHTHCVHLMRASSIHFHVAGKMAMVRPS